MPSGYMRIFIDFAGWTSAHGIPHIGASNSKCLTVFWSVVFLISCCMFTYQMTELVRKYIKYEVTVQTELKFEERIFPSIAMCNLNPYLYSGINQTTDLKYLTNTYQQFLVERKTDRTDPPNAWKIRDANDTITAHAIAQKHLLFISRNMPNATRNELTYKLRGRNATSYDEDFSSRFVLECAYNGLPCNVNLREDPTGVSPVDANGDFAEMFDPQFGNCFLFNHDGKYKGSKAGPMYGLSLLALSSQQEYLPLTESAGIRVAIHSQNEDAFPDAFGYNAAAGFTTSFGIKFVNTKRLPAPHGDCRDTRPTPYYYNGPYSVEGCVRSCAQDAIIKECGCGDPRYKLPPAPTTYSYCRTKDTTQRDCLDKFAATSTQGLLSTCNCPQPCEENTMLIEVYYERMNYQQLRESPAYTLVNLVSDMGGQLGLWLGISVITVVEFLTLMIMCCTYCIAKPDLDKLGAQE